MTLLVREVEYHSQLVGGEQRRQNHLFWIFVCLIFLVYIVFALNLPVSIYTLAGHDDALFWSRALSILQGNWLGDYSQMTLSKGPAFSLFLAINAVSGLPVTLSIALLYFFACFVFVRAVSAIGVDQKFTLIVLVLLLFNPELFPTRVIRDSIYPALTLLVVTGVIRGVYLNTPWFKLIGYGFCLGMFWLLREEGVWVVPGLLFSVVFPLALLAIRKEWQSLKVRLVSFFTFVSAGVFVVIVISAVNYHQYGLFVSVDFKETYFKNSLKVLNSIEVENEISHVPVQVEKRLRAYEVSPTFATMKNYFERDGKNWTHPGCNIYEWTCGDYAGGWFMWAYRDGVAGLGHYSSAENAREFYKRVYLEVSEACSEGVLPCDSNPLPFLPKITNQQFALIPDQFLKALGLLNIQYGVSIDAGPSMGPLNLLQKVRKFLREPYSSPALEEEEYHLTGWFYDHGDQWPELECGGGADSRRMEIGRQASPDLVVSTRNEHATHQRFSLWLIGAKTCRFVYEDDALEIASMFREDVRGYKISASATIYIDTSEKVSDPQRRVSEKIKGTLTKIYKVISPILFILGIVVLIIYLLWPAPLKCKITSIFILAVTLWILVASRIMLLILIEITSFPAINSLYMAPAFPLFSAACILSILLLVDLNNLRKSS